MKNLILTYEGYPYTNIGDYILGTNIYGYIFPDR